MDSEEIKNNRDDNESSVPVTFSRGQNNGITNRRNGRNDLWSGWDPFPEVGRFFSDVMDLFERFSSRFTGMDFYPKNDITRLDGNIIVKVPIPGLNKNSLDVKVYEDHIRISGKHRESSESLGPDGGMFRREETWSSFFKVIPLPVRARQDDARTEYRGDVLYITIPEA